MPISSLLFGICNSEVSIAGSLNQYFSYQLNKAYFRVSHVDPYVVRSFFWQYRIKNPTICCSELQIPNSIRLKRLFGLITSVCGVGHVTAAQIVITTNEFKDINEAKKFACYSGVAPFVKESGIFKGKARVSPMANKKVKTLLHLAALVAIQHDPELRAYYDRKVNDEKKNKMTVINAVRNKLVLRVFACVKQERKYEKNYAKSVA